MNEPIRFSGAPWYDEMPKMSCTIVGLGATGSFAAFFLGRLGISKFNLIDPDSVEVHNIGSQLFNTSDIGARKTDAASNILFNYTSASDVTTARCMVEELDDFSQISTFKLRNCNIVLATLDKMDGRKFLFEYFMEFNTSKDAIFFDSRIGAEVWEVYAVPKNDEDKVKRYRETLFSDDEGNGGACNFQQSSHSAAGAAIQIAETITQWTVNLLTDDTKLPFKITKNMRVSKYGVSY